MTAESGRGYPPPSGGGGTPPALRRSTGYLVKLTTISTLGGLLFGYDTGVISGALPSLREDLQLASLQEAIVVSSLLFGAMVGALIGGKMADKLGRKGSLRVCAVLFLVGALASAVSPSYPFMVGARGVLGIAVGAAAATVPLYLAEMAPANRRGRMVTVNELMIVSGQMLAFLINAIINGLFGSPDVWRWMLAVAAIPAVALLVGLFFLPESPRWLALGGRLPEAREVLAMSRAPAEAETELRIIAEHAQRDTAEDRGAALRDLRAYRWMRRTLWVGVGLAIVQQLTGIGAVIYYAPTILESTGLGVDAALILTVSVGVVGILGTILGIYLLGRVNRRPLLVTGFVGVSAGHILLGLFFLLPASDLRSYVILAAMLLVVFFIQAFIGTLVWLLLSEIFPMAIRGFAMGTAVFVLWATNALVSFVFPLLVDALGSTQTFLLFGVINAGSFFFALKFCPETRGRSLEDLEDDFRQHARAR